MLTRTSIRPKCWIVCCTATAVCARSKMSASTTSALPPAAAISFATVSSRSRRRATSATTALCRRVVPRSLHRCRYCPVDESNRHGQVCPHGFYGAAVCCCCSCSDVIVCEVARQRAVGIGLREQRVGLAFDGGDRIRSGGATRRRLVRGNKLDQRSSGRPSV